MAVQSDNLEQDHDQLDGALKPANDIFLRIGQYVSLPNVSA